LHLVEQPRVLDGDHRLVSERLDQLMNWSALLRSTATPQPWQEGERLAPPLRAFIGLTAVWVVLKSRRVCARLAAVSERARGNHQAKLFSRTFLFVHREVPVVFAQTARST
jgi:hypothetical protein